LLQWLEYYKLEPWGSQWRDVSIARASSAICHSLGNKVTAQDIIPQLVGGTPLEKIYRCLAQNGEVLKFTESELSRFFDPDFVSQVKASQP
jgi:hypothetical protein